MKFFLLFLVAELTAGFSQPVEEPAAAGGKVSLRTASMLVSMTTGRPRYVQLDLELGIPLQCLNWMLGMVEYHFIPYAADG